MGQMQRRKRIGREICHLARRKVTPSACDPLVLRWMRDMAGDVVRAAAKAAIARALERLKDDPAWVAAVARAKAATTGFAKEFDKRITPP